MNVELETEIQVYIKLSDKLLFSGSFQLTNNARRRIALGLVATRKFRRTREDCDSNDQDRDMKHSDNSSSNLHHQPIRNLEKRLQPIREGETSPHKPKMSALPPPSNNLITKRSGTSGRKCTFRWY